MRAARIALQAHGELGWKLRLGEGIGERQRPGRSIAELELEALERDTLENVRHVRRRELRPVIGIRQIDVGEAEAASRKFAGAGPARAQCGRRAAVPLAGERNVGAVSPAYRIEEFALRVDLDARLHVHVDA